MKTILNYCAVLLLAVLIGLASPAKAQETEPDWDKLAKSLEAFARQLEQNLNLNELQDSLKSAQQHFRRLEIQRPDGNTIIIEGDTLDMKMGFAPFMGMFDQLQKMDPNAIPGTLPEIPADQMLPFMLDQMQRSLNLFDGLNLDSLNLDGLFQWPETPKEKEKDLGKKV